ncbi:MAG: nucleoside triphosphate pyrophosphohydrolase [Bacteroidales bacterium]|nr:nucleoside triphosphate pyrophosphohydrolase [Bacteroidales bacterium]
MNKNLEQNAAIATTPEEGIARLNRIMALLRSDCPWDKKQTFDTLRPLTIEEVFELSDALLDNNSDEICEELGDIIMHIAFYARVAEEENRFTFTDILNRICEKLIRRHPHVFDDETVNTDEDVKKNWETIKLTEGKKHSVLSGVPRSLPSMIKAYRIQDKVRGAGFDWEKPEQVWDKVQEEITELQEAVAAAATATTVATTTTATTATAITAKQTESAASGKAAHARIKDELGDVFFSLINYARFLGINPDDALEHTNRKFIKRFKYLEEKTIMQGRSLHNMTLDEMNIYWHEAKKSD